jgi:hypothetical protein
VFARWAGQFQHVEIGCGLRSPGRGGQKIAQGEVRRSGAQAGPLPWVNAIPHPVSLSFIRFGGPFAGQNRG